MAAGPPTLPPKSFAVTVGRLALGPAALAGARVSLFELLSGCFFAPSSFLPPSFEGACVSGLAAAPSARVSLSILTN